MEIEYTNGRVEFSEDGLLYYTDNREELLAMMSDIQDALDAMDAEDERDWLEEQEHLDYQRRFPD